jgi:small conductance mechanosensitive channel
MLIDISILLNETYGLFLHWIEQHGGRVLLVILIAGVVNGLFRTVLSRKRLMPVIDNIPRPKYKNIIGEYQRKRIETVVKALNNTLSTTIWAIAIITVLPEFGVNLGPILAGLGLAGLAVGMAAKDMLTDFIAGFFIIIEGEYSIGDKVKIGGVTGKVMEVSLRRTILQGSGGSIHIVPNREIKLIKRFAGRKKGEQANNNQSAV